MKYVIEVSGFLRFQLVRFTLDRSPRAELVLRVYEMKGNSAPSQSAAAANCGARSSRLGADINWTAKRRPSSTCSIAPSKYGALRSWLCRLTTHYLSREREWRPDNGLVVLDHDAVVGRIGTLCWTHEGSQGKWPAKLEVARCELTVHNLGCQWLGQPTRSRNLAAKVVRQWLLSDHPAIKARRSASHTS